jgi:hypothetical protein
MLDQSRCHADGSFAKPRWIGTPKNRSLSRAATVAKRVSGHAWWQKARSRFEVDQKASRYLRLLCDVIDWRTTMIITWLFDFAKLVQFVREGALIARRRRPDELKRFLAS